MQVIDILGYDTGQLAKLLEFSNGMMSLIWLSVFQKVTFSQHLPLHPPCLLTAHKLLDCKIIWVELCPDSAGTAEVRYARLRADTSPGEDHNPTRLQNKGSNFIRQEIKIFCFHRLPLLF